VQKLSDILGVQIYLNNPIDHDKQLPGSFLSHLDKESSSCIDNRLFKMIIDESKNNEGAYYYYLVLVNEMSMNG
jgi:hypothetical protein